ncbi:PHP domain-containing protein [Alteromonas sp. 5E99-2]|uniref:PHP domain-containing protein n=1 Tax=Alteromonas sp. 5E99-2 TaxID=2817683 RepID=UPI001A97E270|nr:PHP domain-containing protein [Alteromonas sp. 5E99-2]MBO1255437.1 PHP domain-containing protein [Alteromonas sp. 5E99-2]
MKIDLHSHTTASDGQLTPTELMLRAANMQVDVLALTDHDTLGGIDEARAAIAEHDLKLTVIAGIEVSTLWQGFGIHIVGLNVDTNNAEFNHFVSEQKRIREERALRIGEKLERTGFHGVYEQAQAAAKDGEITRAHFGRALVQFHGLGSMAEAFKRFLGKGKAGDVKAQWPSIEMAVNAIQSAGGEAVLAHPLKYDLSTKWIRRLVSHFADVQGDAVEVAGPGVTGQKQLLIHEIVAEAGLKGSVGSDFHAPGRWTELGRFTRVLPNVSPIWQNWPLTSTL